MLPYVSLFLIALVAGALGGLVGTGSSLVLLPALVTMYGPRVAVPIMAIGSIMFSLRQFRGRAQACAAPEPLAGTCLAPATAIVEIPVAAIVVIPVAAIVVIPAPIAIVVTTKAGTTVVAVESVWVATPPRVPEVAWAPLRERPRLGLGYASRSRPGER